MSGPPDGAGSHAAWTTALAAIDDLRFSDRYGNHSRSSIMMSNNAMIWLACIAGIPWLDVRLACHGGADHANPLEPSVRGRAPTSPGLLPRW
jgi:hypothetical protein